MAKAPKTRTNREIFARNLRWARLLHGLSQAELGFEYAVVVHSGFFGLTFDGGH